MKQSLPSYIRVGVTQQGYPYPADSKKFSARCYTAARLTGGAVLGLDPPPFNSTIKNFMLALLQYPNRPDNALVFLLLHQEYSPDVSLLACASAHDPTICTFSFIDVPELTAYFEHFYRILKKQELEHPWMWTERELASILAPSEIKDIIYWKPHTVGEVVFNFWD